MVGEVKKTSKYLESAKMQLAYYLLELKRHGLEGKRSTYVSKGKKKDRDKTR